MSCCCGATRKEKEQEVAQSGQKKEGEMENIA
jgi:hypothetical protein